MLEKVIKVFKQPFNLFLLIFLLVAFVIRVYRIDQLLGFYYDQGRDALVIWDLIQNGKLFLIGPTTGIAGIFRGPFYYYLIAPFYFLGQGNPVWPEVFLIITSVAALWFMYQIANEIGGKASGVVTLILGTFSYEIIYASRWLSNPTPMLLLSMLLVFSLFRIYEGKIKYWMLTSLVLGVSMFHFGSSGELFYFPAVAIFALWQRKNLPDRSTFFKSVAIFFVTFLPLLAFNLRHGGILSNNIGNFAGGSSFGIPTARFLYGRFFEVVGYFSQLLFHAPYDKELLWLFALLIACVFILKELLKNNKFKIVFLLLMSPLLGLLFFQGNYGNVYGYYLTGYFLIFLIILGISLTHIFKNSFLGKIFVVIFLYTFLNQNFFWTKGMLNTQIHDETVIVLANEKEAVNWIYKDAGDRKFNVDVYVPPVIAHSYNYLFKWMKNDNLIEEQTKTLYTLYEIDPDHKDRLAAWLARQDGIGKVIEETRFGGIIVQERERIVKK